MFIDNDVYLDQWQDHALLRWVCSSSLASRLKKPWSSCAPAFQGRQDLLIQSNRGLRQGSLEIFDRTFAITAALRLLAIVVAFIGVLSALMSLQLERVT